MNIIRNVLAIIGAVAIVGIILVYPKMQRFSEFDDLSMGKYMELFNNIIATGNAAEAMVWKRKVNDGLKFEEVEESMKSIAANLNFKMTGEAPFYKEIEAKTQKPFRKVAFYFFCDAMVGRDMLEHSDAYSAFMPCRISIAEDKTGKLWLYTMNMDLMIHGGDPLPPDLKAKALRVKEMMLKIMDGAAKGEF